MMICYKNSLRKKFDLARKQEINVMHNNERSLICKTFYCKYNLKLLIDRKSLIKRYIPS